MAAPTSLSTRSRRCKRTRNASWACRKPLMPESGRGDIELVGYYARGSLGLLLGPQ